MSFDISRLYPSKPTAGIIQPNGCYGSKRIDGDKPMTCPECEGFTWTVHAPFPTLELMVCSRCFRKVQEQGGLSKDKKE